MNAPRQIRHQAFTLVELLTVIATIAILASLLFPILSKTQIKTQRTSCLSNLRQLGLSWIMYKDDNSNLLVESYPVNNPEVWVEGDMTKPDEAGDAELIRRGKLFPYHHNVTVYHCPTDKGVTIAGKLTPTVRSYSMNCFMGARDPLVGPIPSTAANFIPFYAKDSEIRHPEKMWVMLEEDERSINDGFFVTDPTGRIWIDFPTISTHRHAQTYVLNFADGHCMAWQYNDLRTLRVTLNKTEQPGNTDLARLALATSTLK